MPSPAIDPKNDPAYLFKREKRISFAMQKLKWTTENRVHKRLRLHIPSCVVMGKIY